MMVVCLDAVLRQTQDGEKVVSVIGCIAEAGEKLRLDHWLPPVRLRSGRLVPVGLLAMTDYD
jgi:hypothetical protein